MRVIITGGTGLIGKALAMNLVEAGHEVLLLSRNPSKHQGIPDGIQIVGWDGKSARGWGNFVDGAGAIVNLAGESIGGSSFFNMRWTAERKKRILDSRVDAGKSVVEAIQSIDNKPGVLIQASAVGYYGSHPQKSLDEDTPAGSDFLSQVCKQWETATQEVENFGVRRVIIRIGVVIDAKADALQRQMMPFKLFAGGPVGSGKQGYPWIHLQDLVRAIRFLIDTPDARGPYNLTAPHMVTNAEFGHTLAREMKRPYWLPAPAFALRLAFGESASIVLEGQTPGSKKLQDLGFQFKYADLESALKEALG